MRHLILCSLCLASVVLTACGGTTASNTAPKAPVAIALRALMPADINADGTPDGPVSASLRRLLLQVPRELQISRISLTRGAREIKFVAVPTTLRSGERLVELILDQPLGSEAVTLRAGNYELRLTPVAEEFSPAMTPLRGSALAGDLVAPAAMVFDTPEDVHLLCAANLPSITTDVQLVCGAGAPIDLTPSLSPQGLVLTPQTPLVTGRAYRLVADGEDSLGKAYVCGFSLFVRPAGIVAMARADFHRDGKEQLAALTSGGTITLLGDPAAGGEPLPMPVSGRGLDLCVGDLDGNGLPDIAVLLRCEDGFALVTLMADLRANKLQFNMTSRRLTLEAPQSLCAGDFDRDGKDDIVVAGAFGQVLMFTTRLPHRTLEGQPRNLVTRATLIDFDGDRDLDLFVHAADGQSRVVINRGPEGFGEKPEVRAVKTGHAARAAFADFEPNARNDMLLSGGVPQCSLDFDCASKPVGIGLGLEGESVAPFSGAALARDLNNDNRVDVIVAREDVYGFCSDFAVFVNTQGEKRGPDGVFSLDGRYNVNAIEYWRGNIVFGTDSGLLVTGLAPIQVPLNETTRTRFIKGYEPMPKVDAPLSAAVADLNGDGKSDVATIDAGGKLSVWLAAESGEKFTQGGEQLDLGGPGILQAIDFDRDSYPDLLFIPQDNSSRPRLLRNKGDGRLEDDLQGLLPTPPVNLMGAPALGDFNRDGHFDVFWPSEMGLLHFNDGPGRWIVCTALPVVREPSGRVLNFSGELSSADFTGDGLPDVLAVMQPGNAPMEQVLVLFEGTGNADAPFNATVTTAARGHFFELSPADFNGDRRVDLAVGFARAGESAQLTLFTVDAQRQIVPFTGSPSPQGELLDLALDDIDRDGDLDLLLSERVEGEVVITLWINAGDGRYVKGAAADESLKKALRGFSATNLSLADFTGDGVPDLLAVDRDGNVVLVRSSVE
ncbi:MAG: VCBS repeat-containing protein [Planctomycetes bacterium]|nr:VCBS repeat-containing protein [Planctomycetota bacterium]